MLASGQVSIPPLRIACIGMEPDFGPGGRLDALIEIRWGRLCRRFAVEMKALSTPMAFRTAINHVTNVELPTDTLPMIMLPYLSADQLQELEKAGVSGIDLCGNGIVMVSGTLLVSRTGQPNRYTSSVPIKNIYRKNSSMVPRVFLAQPRFDRVSEVLAGVNARNLLVAAFSQPPMVLATVSKAIKALEEDLIVSRESGQLKLLQPDKLLEKLLESYQVEKPQLLIRRRATTPLSELPAQLAGLSKELNLPVVATGLASVDRYAVMQRGDLLSVYCPRPEVLLARLPAGESDRFPNLEIVASEDETVYFDCRQDDKTGFRWASPLQTYLEMMRGDQRDQQTASQVRADILRKARTAP